MIRILSINISFQQQRFRHLHSGDTANFSAEKVMSRFKERGEFSEPQSRFPREYEESL